MTIESTAFHDASYTDGHCAGCGAAATEPNTLWLSHPENLCFDCRQETKKMPDLAIVHEASDTAMVIHEATLIEPRAEHPTLASAREYLEMVQVFTFDGQEDREMAAEVCATLKGQLETIEAEEKAATGPIEAGLTKIRSWFKEPKAVTRAALDAWKAGYLASERALLESSAAAAQRVAQAVAEGDSRGAALAHAMVNIPEPTKGLQVRKLWRARVVNAGMLASELLMPNQKAIDAELRRQVDAGQEPVIAGVICEQVESVAVTS